MCFLLLDDSLHYDVIKWKHLSRYWPFVRRIRRSPVGSNLKGQWRGASMFTLISVGTNGWANNGDADDLRRNKAQCNVTIMINVMWHMFKILRVPASWCTWRLNICLQQNFISVEFELWGKIVCVSVKMVQIKLGSGIWRQAITHFNAVLLPFGPIGTTSNVIRNKTQLFDVDKSVKNYAY